jgi:DNA-binding transcriptional LysR family regulator
MELRHLRYFVTVAEELNISRAAARLRISQPAISRQIKDLESEVGVALFRREANGLKLTPAGQSFVAHAKDILRRSSDSLMAMTPFKGGATESITIGYISTAIPSFLAQGLRTFAERHPNVAVNLHEMAPKPQINALRQGKLDLAFLGNPCPELKTEFTVTIVKRLPLAIAVPDHHILALRKKVSLDEFKGDDFIGLDEEQFPGRNEFICETAQAAGFTPRIKQKADSLASMLAIVASGKGVALVPNDLEFLPHTKAAIIPLKNCPARIQWAVASRKDAGPTVQAFLKTLAVADNRKPASIVRRR